MSAEEAGYVPPVDVHDLATAALPGRSLPATTRTLLDQEFVRLRARRAAHGLNPPTDHDLTGIALSGGGIRSATFALGVLQALAAHDLLKRFDYLSTVSGGGYIGSSLTWWWSDRSGRKDGIADEGSAFGTGPANFPYGTDSPSIWRGRVGDGSRSGPLLLTNLRKHGNYLTPGGGIGILSGVSVVLRAVLLNLIVWLPIVTGLMLLLLALLPGSAPGAGTEAIASGATIRLFVVDAVLIAGVLAGFAVLYILVLDHLYPRARRAIRRGEAPWWARAVRWTIDDANGWLWLPLIAVAATGVLLWLPPDAETWPGLALLLGVAGILASTFAILCIVYALVTGLEEILDSKLLRRVGYRMRRMFEAWAGFFIKLVGALAILGAVPVVTEWVTSDRPWLGEGGSGVIALLTGLAGAIVAFLRSGSRVEQALRDRGFKVSGGFSAMVAAVLILFGVVLIAHDTAKAVHATWAASGWPFLAVLGLAVLSGVLANVNHVSLGRFYRDRLMEAYMPGFRQAKACDTGPAPRAADEMKLHEASMAAPYHIINTNVVLISASDRRRRIRGGDNFILTPDYCGSNATGWCPTRRFMGDGMTLVTAMATSGAAANPNTGIGGVGLTRSRVVSVLMALLNMRLGYWVPHPKLCNGGMPNHFHPAFSALLFGYREDYPWQELTDGGHFENLGLYELVRRRARLILVADGGQDPECQFEDLQAALRRIGEDFGAKVEFYGSHSIEDLIPAAGGHHYPRGLELAKRGFAVARVCYPPDFDPSGALVPEDPERSSLLIYLATTVVDGLPLELRGYKGKNPAFPDQSTGDQFFDEDQFEAYRELGYRIAEAMIGDVDLEDLLCRIQPNATAGGTARQAA
jgi:hypothetical protein